MTRASKFTRPLALAACAGFAFTMAPAAMADDHVGDSAEEMTKGEKRLAKLLEGREAGEPQRCIRNFLNDRMQTIDKTAYVYGSGKTIYVQRTRDPENIDRSDTLVSRRFNATQICRMDVTHTIDPFIGMFTGAVFFTDFVPYTRIDESDG